MEGLKLQPFVATMGENYETVVAAGIIWVCNINVFNGEMLFAVTAVDPDGRMSLSHKYLCDIYLKVQISINRWAFAQDTYHFVLIFFSVQITTKPSQICFCCLFCWCMKCVSVSMFKHLQDFQISFYTSLDVSGLYEVKTNGNKAYFTVLERPPWMCCENKMLIQNSYWFERSSLMNFIYL